MMKKKSLYIPVLAAMTACLAPALPATAEGTHGALTQVRAGFTRSGHAAGIDMTIQLDSVKVSTGKRLILRPLLCGATDTLQLQPIVINGRKAGITYLRNDEEQIDGALVVNAKQEPREVQYRTRVPYRNWMDNAKVYVVEDRCGCGITNGGSLDDATLLGQLARPLGDANSPMQYSYQKPAVEAVKARSESGCAYINFPVNQTVILNNYHENRRELDKILQTINVVKNDSHIQIDGIQIHGYASPEGTYANNTRLAQGRAEALTNYVASIEQIPRSKFAVEATPEDWDGLRDSIRARAFTQADAMLALIDGEQDADTREAKLRQQYPTEYATLLKEVYPRLRHSNYTVRYTVRNFSLEEAREYMQTHPDYLSLDEYFQVANSYAKGSDERVKALQQAAAQFPDDATAQLNAAIASLEADDLSTAARYAQQAGDSCGAHNVRGVIALRQGNLDAARQEFAQAASQGDTDAAHNLKMVEAISDTQSQQVLDD
jgi:outer membrane protein OmpA-like peptidoglycan-associated protein